MTYSEQIFRFMWKPSPESPSELISSGGTVRLYTQDPEGGMIGVSHIFTQYTPIATFSELEPYTQYWLIMTHPEFVTEELSFRSPLEGRTRTVTIMCTSKEQAMAEIRFTVQTPALMPIEGASVYLDGMSEYTDAQGLTPIFKVEPLTTFDWEVSYAGRVTQTGTVTSSGPGLPLKGVMVRLELEHTFVTVYVHGNPDLDPVDITFNWMKPEGTTHEIVYAQTRDGWAEQEVEDGSSIQVSASKERYKSASTGWFTLDGDYTWDYVLVLAIVEEGVIRRPSDLLPDWSPKDWAIAGVFGALALVGYLLYRQNELEEV